MNQSVRPKSEQAGYCSHSATSVSSCREHRLDVDGAVDQPTGCAIRDADKPFRKNAEYNNRNCKHDKWSVDFQPLTSVCSRTEPRFSIPPERQQENAAERYRGQEP